MSKGWSGEIEFAPPHFRTPLIALDTSALSALKEPSVFDEVYDAMKARRCAVIVPVMSLVECADSDDEPTRVPRMLAAWRFTDVLAEACAVGADMHMSLRAEWARAGRTAPALLHRGALPTLRERTTALGARPQVCKDYIRKGYTTSLDESAARAFEENGVDASIDDLDAHMGKFRENVLTPDPKSFALPFVTRTSSWARRQTARLPHRFPLTTTAAGLAQLHAWSALFRRVGYGPWADVLSAPRRGDWVDMGIAIAAARADVLITEDRILRKRVNFVADHLGTSLRAEALIDWLWGP